MLIKGTTYDALYTCDDNRDTPTETHDDNRDTPTETHDDNRDTSTETHQTCEGLEAEKTRGREMRKLCTMMCIVTQL